MRILDDVLVDVRHALRVVARQPGFAAAVIITLALGIGGTTAIFSVVDRLFLRGPAGVRDATEVRKLFVRRNEGSITTEKGGTGSYLDFEALRDHAPAFASVAAHGWPTLLDLGRGEDAEQIRGTYATWQFLPLLGVRPVLGRLILPEEDGPPGVHQVAVISYDMWQRKFAGARDVIGKTLLLNGRQVTIVGVAHEGFTGITADPSDVFLPLAARESPQADSRTYAAMAGFLYVARLAPGVRDEHAVVQGSAAMAQKAASLTGQDVDPTPELMMTPLTYAAQPVRSKSAALSLWLTLVAALALLVACANVANLLLARAMAARRELSVRLALGATRVRLIRQQLTQSAVLALLGGMTGLLVTQLSVGLMRRFPLPPDAGTIDLRVLGFALAVSLISGLMFGVLPALKWRAQPMQAMREARTTISVAGIRLRRVLVAVQLTFAVVLVVGAGLFARSLRAAYAIDPGVDVDRTVVATVSLARSRIPREQREAFYQEAQARLARVPAIERSAMVHFHPFSGSAMSTAWRSPLATGVKFEIGPYINLAGAGYFETVGTRILQGRGFNDRDDHGGPVAVVNETMARGIAPPGAAVGLCIQLRDQVEQGGCTRVIGVVEDQRHSYLDDMPVPMIFFSRAHNPAAISWGGPALVVRTRGPATEQAASVRAAIVSMRPDLSYVTVKPLEEVIRSDLMPYRLGAMLFSLFGMLALALAAVGLAGVLGYFVTERTSEIGIRRSLGAPAREVIWLVVRQALAPIVIGVIIGLAAALGLFRFLGSLLFGVTASDPITIAGAVAALLLMAVLAVLVPALRASRVDPMLALRSD